MAIIEGRATVKMQVTIALSEDEAAALDALAGYNIEEFLRVFYEHMGTAYLRPHENGLRSLFAAVHDGSANVSGYLEKARDARAVFDGTKRAVGG